MFTQFSVIVHFIILEKMCVHIELTKTVIGLLFYYLK